MKKQIAVVIALALAASCASAPPTPDAQGRRLVDQMKAAMGGSAWDKPSTFHKSGAAERGGQHVTYEVWGDMRGLKTVSFQTVGGRTFGGGFDGVVSWGKGPDGQVRTNTSPEAIADARFGAYASVGGWFFPDRFPATFTYKGRQAANGKDYDVVEVMPPGASFPAQLWLDPQTHVLKRTSASNGKESFVADTRRYQTVDGVQIDFRSTHVDDGTVEEQTLEQFEFAPAPAETFSPPK
jgi:hypothetical protein